MSQQQPASMQTCQIIAAALMMGVAMFAGIAVIMTLGGDADEAVPPANEELPINLILVSVMGLGVLGARKAVLYVQDQQLGKHLEEMDVNQIDDSELMGRFQTRTIISLAMLEGIAFFALVMFIVETDWKLFGIAMLMLAWMAANFPTNNKFQAWLNANSGKNAYGGEE